MYSGVDFSSGMALFLFVALRHDQGPHPTTLGREVTGDVEGIAVVVIGSILARNSFAVFQ